MKMTHRQKILPFNITGKLVQDIFPPSVLSISITMNNKNNRVNHAFICCERITRLVGGKQQSCMFGHEAVCHDACVFSISV